LRILAKPPFEGFESLSTLAVEPGCRISIPGQSMFENHLSLLSICLPCPIQLISKSRLKICCRLSNPILACRVLLNLQLRGVHHFNRVDVCSFVDGSNFGFMFQTVAKSFGFDLRTGLGHFEYGRICFLEVPHLNRLCQFGDEVSNRKYTAFNS
jgi:hypothetical protein